MDKPDRKALLEGLQAELRERIQRYEAHRHHLGGALDKDLDDQAAQAQNDEVVDQLEEEATQELAQIERALARIDAQLGERCEKCGEPIAPGRLQALPYTTHCRHCAVS